MIILHSINDILQGLDSNELVLSKTTIENMFEHDMTFAAKQTIDTKDLR